MNTRLSWDQTKSIQIDQNYWLFVVICSFGIYLYVNYIDILILHKIRYIYTSTVLKQYFTCCGCGTLSAHLIALSSRVYCLCHQYNEHIPCQFPQEVGHHRM